jgi:1-phosphofructokinase family hexose kinase
MIVTVTPNTCLDRTLVVPEFTINKTIRAGNWAIGMGGKAADASWILGEYGLPSIALGFKAGITGLQMEQMLQSRGVQTDFTEVDGETRLNTVIVMEDGSGQSTFSVSSLIVRPTHIHDLETRYESVLEKADCVVIGGTLPAGVSDELFFKLIARARKRQIPVIFDASGSALRKGLEGKPTLVKPNRDELEEFTGRRLNSLTDIHLAGKEIQAVYGCSVVVTLGGDGTLAVLPERDWLIPVLPVDVVSTAGAGDGMLAGMAAALSSGRPMEEGLRLGSAMAGAVCMQLATADCRKADIEALSSKVQLVPFA